MAAPFQFPVYQMLNADDVPKHYAYLFKDGPQYARNLVINLLEERDKVVGENEYLHQSNTWTAERLPDFIRFIVREGPMNSTDFVTTLGQFTHGLYKNIEMFKEQGRTFQAADKDKAEKIHRYKSAGEKLIHEKKLQDQKMTTMQSQHSTTMNSLRNENKLLRDDNVKNAQVLARGQIANKQLLDGNAQKDQLIQQLQERIQVLEQQPQASNDPDAMVEDPPDGFLTPDQQIQWLHDDVAEYKTTVEGLEKDKADDAAKVQDLEERLQNGSVQFDQLHKDKAADAAKIQDLEERLQNGSVQYNQLQEQMTQVTQREEVAKQAVAGLQQEKSDNLATIQGLQQPNSDGSLPTAQIQTLQTRVAELQQTEQAANQKITELQTVVTNTSRELDIVKEARNTQSDKLVKKTTAFENLSQEHRTYKAQVDSYKEELNKVVEENDRLEQLIAENEAPSGDKQDVQKLHAEITDLKARLEGATLYCGQADMMKRGWQEDKDKDLKAARKEKTEVVEKLSDANEKIAQIMSQLTRPEEEKIKFFKNENDRLRIEWGEMAQEVEETKIKKKDFQALKTKNEDMARELEEAKQSKIEAEGNAEQAEEECRAAELENGRFERKIEQLEEDIATLRRNIKQLSRNIVYADDGSFRTPETHEYVALNETNRGLTTQVSKMADEHRAKVEELEANNIYHDGVRVTQEEFNQTFDAATQAIRHDNGIMVTRQEWSDTRARAYQAATNEDGTLVTNEQVQKLNSQIIRKADGSVATLEEVRELESQVRELGSKVQQLESQVEDLKSKLIFKDNGTIVTKSEICEYEQQLKKQIADLLSEAKEAKDGSEKRIAELASGLEEAMAERNVAQKKCIAMDKELADLRAQLKEAHKAKDGAEKKWSEMKKNGSKLGPKRENGTIVDQPGYEEEVKVRKNVIAQLQLTITEEKAKVADLELSKKEDEEVNNRLKVELQSARDESKSARDENTDMMKLKVEEEQGKKSLTEELTSARDKNADMKKSKAEDEEEIARLTEELSSAKDKISKLEAAPPNFAAEIQRLEDSLARVTEVSKQRGQQIERLDSTIADLTKEIQQKDDQNEELYDEREVARSDLRKALDRHGKFRQEHSSCGKSKSELISMRSKFSKLEKQLDQRDETVEKARKEAEEMYEQKEKVLDTQNATLAEAKQLQDQLSQSEKDNEILRTGKAEVEANLEAVNQESAGLMKAMDGLNDDIKSMEKEAEAREEENHKLRAKVQKKADPSEPKAPTPRFTATDASAQKPLLDNIAEEDDDNQIVVTGGEFVASTPILPTLMDDASHENGEAGAAALPHAIGTAADDTPTLPTVTDDASHPHVLPHATGTTAGDTPTLPTVMDSASHENGGADAPALPHGTGTAAGDTPILPTVVDDASYENGEAGAPALPHAAGTAAGDSNGLGTAPGAPTTIVPDQIQTEHPSATSGLGWKFNGLFWLLLLLLFFGVSMGVSWWRRTELLDRGDDLTRLAFLSLRAGGGTGTAWPAWLYDDDLVEIVGGFYG